MGQGTRTTVEFSEVGNSGSGTVPGQNNSINFILMDLFPDFVKVEVSRVTLRQHINNRTAAVADSRRCRRTAADFPPQRVAAA